MPLTVRERVLVAFEAVMAGLAPAVPDLKVERNRDTEVATFPTLVVLDGGQRVGGTKEITEYTLSVAVEIYAGSAGSDSLGPAVNDLYGRIVAAAYEDETLGGLSIEIREGDMVDPELDREAGHGPMMATAVTFEIDYETPRGDPYTVAS